MATLGHYSLGGQALAAGKRNVVLLNFFFNGEIDIVFVEQATWNRRIFPHSDNAVLCVIHATWNMSRHPTVLTSIVFGVASFHQYMYTMPRPEVDIDFSVASAYCSYGPYAKQVAVGGVWAQSGAASGSWSVAAGQSVDWATGAPLSDSWASGGAVAEDWTNDPRRSGC